MILYGDVVSPYVRTCLVVAHEVGLAKRIDLQPAEVRIASVNESLAAISPLAQIPLLLTTDGAAVYDSRVIIDYLCQLSKGATLLPVTGRDRHRVLTLQAIGLGMADAAVASRNEVAQRPAELHWHAWLGRQRRRVEMALDSLENEWIPDLAAISIGTLTVAVTLSYLDLRFGDWQWRSGRPRLSQAHAAVNSRPSMVYAALPHTG
jgi:glutathione S-transferase